MRLLFLLFTLLIQTVNAQDVSSDSSLDASLDRTLKYAEGHASFRSLVFKDHEQEFVRLVREGQSPNTLFIGCSDSRVIPELISQSRPGTLFVIRTAGNFVPPYNLQAAYDGVGATIEYAVNALGVRDIIVCGHSHCGAIEGLFAPAISTDPNYRLIAQWLQFGYQARDLINDANVSLASPRERYALAERLSVLYQLEHLLTFPFVKDKVSADVIHLHGWHFDIESGSISYWSPEARTFKPLLTTAPSR